MKWISQYILWYDIILYLIQYYYYAIIIEQMWISSIVWDVKSSDKSRTMNRYKLKYSKGVYELWDGKEKKNRREER